MTPEAEPAAADIAPPPLGRSAVPGRALAWLVLGIVFWVDSLTPLGVGDQVLYIVAILLFLPAGRWWEPLAVAVAASVLTIAGAFLSHPRDEWDIALWNRPLALLAIWITAGLVAQHRRTLSSWHARIADDRRLRDASIERLEEMRYALDQAAIVAATDHRGLITYANDKFCNISKYAREELIGQDHRIINSGYHPPEFIRTLWRTIARGDVWRGELRNRAKDGSIYWVDTTIVPFLNAQGKPRQYLAIRSDITARKSAEARLADQAALAQLGQLAAMIAHEVRNPLAGVRGTLEVLKGRLPPDHADRRIFDAMILRMDALNAKVVDMLRFARPRTPDLQSVDLRHVVDDVVESAHAAAAKCAIRTTGVGITARADPEMLRAVLLNLVLNACQVSPTVDLEITTEGTDARVIVADRGPGIPAEQRERVFEAFFTTKQSGTGLGLAIVKRFTEMQDGRITLEPREGGGTVAVLTLPLSSHRSSGATPLVR
jgi:two-component system CheB/CheR fusion protein